MILASALAMQAAEPNGYYSTCQGKSGAALLKQLEAVISDHDNVGYDGLWTLYQKSDVDANGKIWDMYSTKRFTYKTEQCGNYKNVGDCYNREHSMPKSWFNDASPMYSDAFHIYPTDGKVNGQRSDYPYGECANGTTLASSGSVKALGKLGSSTFSGYSGTVFEPDDEYKGDFARSYFYMAAAYNSRISSWNSDMLAGNAYPAFTSWAVNLLLKWHRQDPVSDKELARNEAVYAAQHNRNPFIDHPELAEHIWGTKSSQGWTGTAADPEITLPVNGSTVNLGNTMVGFKRTASVVVKGVELSGNIDVAVSGNAFSASTSRFAASAANTTSGYTVTVTFNPASAGTFTGSLTVTCGSLSSKITLTANAYTTIPAGPVTVIGDESFDATWSYVGDDIDGFYTLSVEGMAPVKVNASDESFTVTGLEPSTTYYYTVSSKSYTSQKVSVTTLDPIPSVDVYFDGNLVFSTIPGEPSDAAELLLDIVNIDDPITLQVNAPFQLSDDKSSWAEKITIDPEEDRVYLRLYSANVGTFSGTLVITAGDYRNDDVEFTGTVASDLFEDFDGDASTLSGYTGGTYYGKSARWKFVNAGIFTDLEAHSGDQAIRFGKNKDSYIEMEENTKTGIGSVSFWAYKWESDNAAVTYVVEYSTDGGNTWKESGKTTLPNISNPSYQQYTYTVNTTVPTRIRVRQTAGARWVLDDLEAKSFSGLVPESVADYHRWDAFCRGGELVIEASEAVEARVYALDGTEVVAGRIAEGLTTFAVQPGLYIVVVDNFVRRVVVK